MISVGLTCPVMAPDGCYEQAMIESCDVDTFKKIKFLVTFGGPPIEGLEEGRGPVFISNYAKLYKNPPNEAYATYGYECGIFALESIRKAGVKNKDKIREAGVTMKNFDGTIGRWDVDENGDTSSKRMSGNTIVVEKDKDGKDVAKFKFERFLTVRKSTTP
jgi:branched-chain amino acid transport system substrate-binding protein